MELIGARPGRRVIAYFLAVIIIGTILLSLPQAGAAGTSIGIINALFTSTSAVCVTGLVVLDTARDFTIFGQCVILVLIQLGGIGIMMFATLLIIFTGSRLPFLDRQRIAESFGSGKGARPLHLLKAVMAMTFGFEAAGAAVLFFKFRETYPFGEALFNAVFHAVSAFCNAGFSNLPHGLEDYFGSPLTIYTFAIMIICGGLGFIVLRELAVKIADRKHRFSLHTKLCLTITGILLVAGMFIFLAAESGNVFAGKGLFTAMNNAFFQSVTARTAGFNTIPQINLTEVSLLFTMILMFIGACPGSTAGGIKTTTVGVLLILIYSRFRGRSAASVFKRTISSDSVSRALTVLLLSVVIINIVLALVMFAEERPLAHALSHGWFVDNLFEVISAFGTVGLSLGLTPGLSSLGKLAIVLTMFIGRVGLLTLAFALARPPQKGEVVYLDEPVMVG